MIKRVILHDIASQEDVFDLDNGKLYFHWLFSENESGYTLVIWHAHAHGTSP